MNKLKGLKKLMLAPLALMLAIGLSACAGGTGGTVAATFDGGEVMEDEVTSYVAQIRSAYGLEDDADWAEYLGTIGMSASQVREDIINMLAEEKIVANAAAEAGLSVDESEIDSTIEGLKSQAASEEEFEQTLAAQGMTEEQLRDSYKQYALSQLVREQLVPVPEATPEQVQEYIDRDAPGYSGAKRSSHILFDLDARDAAENVLQQARYSSAETFAELARANSKDSSAQSGGDVGWDKLTTFVEEYQAALDGLSVGQVTQELVESQFGYHIIMCTEQFEYREGMTEADIPEAILEQIKSTMNSDLETQAYTDYVSQLIASANLAINEMPSGLPYDVAPQDDAATQGAAPAADAAPATDAAPADAAPTTDAAPTDAAPAADAAPADAAPTTDAAPADQQGE